MQHSWINDARLEGERGAKGEVVVNDSRRKGAKKERKSIMTKNCT
mgnify:CR=1 FL=1